MCKGCGHYRKLEYPKGLYICHYALDTEKLRAMPVEECVYHTGANKKMKPGYKWNETVSPGWQDRDALLSVAAHLSVHAIREQRKPAME